MLSQRQDREKTPVDGVAELRGIVSRAAKTAE